MSSPELRRRIWRAVRIGGGSVLRGLGIVGLVLPFLQGIALILMGLAVLATDVPWARRWLHALRDRLRRFRKRARRPGSSGHDKRRDGQEDRQAG